jgi:hypothetical protein
MMNGAAPEYLPRLAQEGFGEAGVYRDAYSIVSTSWGVRAVMPV